VEILKQLQYSPMSVEKQVAIIYCGTKGLLAKVPVQDIKKAEEELLMILQNSHSGVLKDLKAGKIDDAITSVIEKVAADICAKY
jgi:F-type H+-transporting ATPase subunit alpha